MDLFPKLGDQYYDQKDRDILAFMESFYQQSITSNQTFWDDAALDVRVEAGDTSAFSQLYGSTINRYNNFSFNRCRRVVNMISGYQRRNRMSTIAVPRESGDQQTADQLSKVLMWANQSEGMLETISNSFHSTLITGMSLLQVWADYRNDPLSGDLKLTHKAYNSFIIDPFFKNLDLSDCNGIWTRSFLTKNAVISMMPDKEELINELPTSSRNDGKFYLMPQNYNNNFNGLLSYDEFHYRDYRTQQLLYDAKTGSTVEWTGKSTEDLEYYLSLYPQITLKKNIIPTTRLAIVVQGKVLFDGPNPMGIDRYSFVPVVAYYNPDLSYFSLRCSGVIRGMRDAQYLFNRLKNIELATIESVPNSGWIAKEGAFVDPKMAHMTGPGRILYVKGELSDVAPIQAASLDQSIPAATESIGKEILEGTGVSEELLGSAVDDKAGVLAMLRQSGSLTTLQGLFDSLDQSQKIVGDIMVEYIQKNFTPGKVERIIEEEPTHEFYDKTFGRYDCIVQEGLNTISQKQMAFVQLLKLKEIGVPVPDKVLLDAVTVQNKNELLEEIDNINKQQAQQQEQQLQSQMQLQQTQSAYNQAKTDEALSLSRERDTKSVQNIAGAKKNEMETYQSLETAQLEKIKALKELDGMNLAHLKSLIEMAKMLQEKTIEPTNEGTPL